MRPTGVFFVALLLFLFTFGALRVPGADATLYTGHSSGSWAEIEISSGFIRSYYLKLPSTCRDQTRSSRFTMQATAKIRIRKHGGFYRDTRNRWSRTIMKGRVIGNRVQGSVWFADFGDYVQCWTGTGARPEWVRFKAWKPKH